MAQEQLKPGQRGTVLKVNFNGDNLIAKNWDMAVEEFILSRKADNCRPDTIIFYQNHCEQFVRYAKSVAHDGPIDVKNEHIRHYIIYCR